MKVSFFYLTNSIFNRVPNIIKYISSRAKTTICPRKIMITFPFIKNMSIINICKTTIRKSFFYRFTRSRKTLNFYFCTNGLIYFRTEPCFIIKIGILLKRFNICMNKLRLCFWIIIII